MNISPLSFSNPSRPSPREGTGYFALSKTSDNHISPLSFSPVGEMQVTLYIEGLSMSWCISPSPTGEARWGLMPFSLSNQFLPLGKVRMGCPFGKVRMGLRL